MTALGQFGSFLRERQRWVLIALLVVLHVTLLAGVSSAVSLMFWLVDVGLFLIWQPLWRAQRRIDPHLRGQEIDQLHQPLRFVQHRADLLLEGQPGQPRSIALQGAFAVVPPEIGGVGVARPQDIGIALAHQARIVRLAIGHGDEVGQEDRGA